MMKKTLFKVYYGPAFQAADVERRNFPIPSSLAALNGLTVLFIADLHLSAMFPAAAAERLIAQANALEPDLICLGGDYAETEADQAKAVEILSTLRAPLGRFAVFGNNDCEHFSHNGRLLTEALWDAGITPLIDREAAVRVGDCRLRIAGLNALREETSPRRPFFRHSDDRDFRIAISHYPQSLLLHRDDFAATPHLGLTGHTHGGQFNLLGLTPFSIGFELLSHSNKMPAVGWTEKSGFPVLISEGVGTSRLPLRLNVPPTIHLITLSRGDKK